MLKKLLGTAAVETVEMYGQFDTVDAFRDRVVKLQNDHNCELLTIRTGGTDAGMTLALKKGNGVKIAKLEWNHSFFASLTKHTIVSSCMCSMGTMHNPHVYCMKNSVAPMVIEGKSGWLRLRGLKQPVTGKYVHEYAKLQEFGWKAEQVELAIKVVDEIKSPICFTELKVKAHGFSTKEYVFDPVTKLFKPDHGDCAHSETLLDN